MARSNRVVNEDIVEDRAPELQSYGRWQLKVVSTFRSQRPRSGPGQGEALSEKNADGGRTPPLSLDTPGAQLPRCTAPLGIVSPRELLVILSYAGKGAQRR